MCLVTLANSLLAGSVDREAIVQATSPAAKGLAIAQAADQRDNGWNDWSATARMVLHNRHGESSERAMRMQALEEQTQGLQERDFHRNRLSNVR